MQSLHEDEAISICHVLIIGRAGVELLWMLHSMRLRSNPTLEYLHPPLKLDVVFILLSSQVVGVNNDHDGPVALAGWTVIVGDLKKQKRGRTTIIVEL